MGYEGNIKQYPVNLGILMGFLDIQNDEIKELENRLENLELFVENYEKSRKEFVQSMKKLDEK